MLERLEELKGRFWTVRQELIEEIEEMGFEVEEENEEYIAVTDSEDEEYEIHLINAGHTIAVGKIA